MKKTRKILAMVVICVIAVSLLAPIASANPSTYWCDKHKQTGCTHCLSHTVQNVAAATASCTSGGGTVRACTASGCGSVFFQNAPLGHSYTNKVCTRSTNCGEVDGSTSGWHYMFRVGNHLRKISSPYPTRNDGRSHSGIDITAPSGTTYDAPTYSVGSGTVKVSEYNTSGFGNLVVLSIDDFTVYYAHLNSRNVSSGNSVNSMTQVGNVGNTGNVEPTPTPSNPTAGAHLHFELRNSNGNSNGGASAYNPTGRYPSGVFS